jgi:5'-3' exonuclease
MEIRTLLVDSSYLLKRSLNGAKDISTDKFGMIGGLYQFFTTIRKLITDHKINKVVLAWDGENGGFYRYKMDKAYKSNRKNKSWYNKINLTEYEIKKEEEKNFSVLKQKKRIQAYAEELFFRQIEVDKIEADDIISLYCQTYNEKEEIYLYSKDQDFLQLLKYNITILFPNIQIPITKQTFMLNFEYHYSNSLTMKIICGDNSDVVEGVKGVQQKTLLKYFPDLKFRYMSVKEICMEAKKINEDRIINKKKELSALKNILNSIDRMKLNYKLVNLDEPIINDEVKELFEYLEVPLSMDDRNSKNLYNLMIEDEFLNIYKSTFVNYVKPFYPVITQEQQKFKEYYK